MSKIAVEMYLKNTDKECKYNINAIYDKSLNILKFQEPNSNKMLLCLDLSNKTITRENKELKMILTFDKKQVKIINCKLKEIDKNFSFELHTKELEVNNNKFFVEYETYLDTELLDTVVFEIKFLDKIT